MFKQSKVHSGQVILPKTDFIYFGTVQASDTSNQHPHCSSGFAASVLYWKGRLASGRKIVTSINISTQHCIQATTLLGHPRLFQQLWAESKVFVVLTQGNIAGNYFSSFKDRCKISRVPKGAKGPIGGMQILENMSISLQEDVS